ncbi:MAG: AsmA-like C-terminal region-containing protein [Methylophilaceae bacterium]
MKHLKIIIKIINKNIKFCFNVNIICDNLYFRSNKLHRIDCSIRFMDLSTNYTKTGRGLRAQIKKLPPNAGQILFAMNTTSSGTELHSKLRKMNIKDFELAITWLLEGGYIRVITTEAFSNSVWAPVTQSAIQVSEISFDEFNQTIKATIAEAIEALVKTSAEQETVTQPPLETIKTISKTKADSEEKSNRDIKAKIEALSKADAEANARAGAQVKAETKAKIEADEHKNAEVIAQKDAEIKSKLEIESKAAAEVKAKAAALAKADAEARERAEAQVKASVDAKAAIEAKQKAEALAKADAEARERAEAQAKIEAEAKEKADKIAAEAQAKVEAKAKAKALARAELLAKAEAIEKARLGAEAKAKAAAEAKALAEEEARKAAEQKAKEEAEALARAEAEAAEQARLEAEAKAKALAEEEARKAAEQKAKEEAEALAKEEAEAAEQSRLEAEAKAEALAKARAKAKEKAEEKAKKVAARKAAVTQFKADTSLKVQKFTKVSEGSLQQLHQAINIRKLKKARKQWQFYFLKFLKKLFFYATAIIILLVIAAQFINLSILVKPIEQLATTNLNSPVTIEEVHASLFPKPHLTLNNVNLGEKDTANAKNILIFPAISPLIERIKNPSTFSQIPFAVEVIRIDGLTIAQKDLLQPSTWIESINQHKQLKIEQILLKQIALKLNDLELPMINGEIALNTEGLLKNARLSTEENNLTLDIEKQSNQYRLNLKGSKWRSPLTPNLLFSELTANGIFENNTLTINQINAYLYDGKLSGKMIMDLSTEWQGKGDFELNGLNLSNMANDIKLDSVIEGNLSANSNFTFIFNTTANAIELEMADTRFKINDGQLKKVDLIEAMRSNNIAGTTRFAELSGNLLLENNKFTFKNLTLEDKQLQAYGHLDINPDKTILADIYSKIPLKANPIKAHLLLSGNTDNIKLKK